MSNSREHQALVYDLTRFQPELGVKVGLRDHIHNVGEGHPIY